MTYDTTDHDFRVVVTDSDLDGKLEIDRVEAIDAETKVEQNGVGNWEIGATYVNIYEVGTASLTLQTSKILSGREMKDGEFRFTLTAVTIGAPMPVDTTGTSVTAVNGKLGHVVFPPIVYTDADNGKTYTYIIEEVDNDLGGVGYDKSKYEVTVTVTVEEVSGVATAVATVVYKRIQNAEGTEVSQTINAEDVVFHNTYTAASVTAKALTAKKTLTNLTPGADAVMSVPAFSFTLTENGVDQTKTNDANGVVAFDAITYTAAGTYVYELREVVNNTNGITCDTNWYKITVVVKDNGQGNLYVASTSYLLNGTTPVNADKVVFANTYKAVPNNTPVILNGSKVLKVEQNKGLTRTLKENDFSFTLAALNGAPMGVTGTTQTVKNDADGNFAFTQIIFDTLGTYEYTITEVGAGTTVNGVTYDHVSYKVTVTVKDDQKDGILETAVTYTKVDGQNESNAAKAEFVNEYKVTDAELPLHAHKHLQGRPMVHGEFKFTLTAKNNAPMPAGYDAQTGVTNGYRGHIDFGKITYTAVGEYVYIIEETAHEDAVNGVYEGVTYDNVKYTVTVEVVDNDEGALVASIIKVMQDDGTVLADGAEIEFTNRYKADKVTVTLEGEKLLDDLTSVLSDKQVVKNEDFTFHLKNENEQVVASVRNDKNGKFKFEREYAAPATEVYWIEEVAGSIPGMTYDATKYKVTVTVTDDLEGKLVADVQYKKVTAEVKKDATKVEFNNTYKAKETTVTFQGLKTFEGGRDLKENEFSFTLTALNGAPMSVNASSETVKNAVGGKFTFSTITFTEEGIFTYELTEVKGDDKQVTYDATKYTLTVTVTDVNGELKATTAITKGSESVEEYGFTNIFAPTSASVDIAVQKVLKNESEKEMSLKGFKFQLVGVEKTGTATAESNDKGEAKFTLTFTADDIGKTFTYKLSEVDTEVADVTYDETVYEIKVVVGQNKTTGEIILTVTCDGKTMQEAAEFVNTYAPAPEKEPEKDPDESPKTMDDFRLGGWLLMMSVSAVCLLAVIVLGKKFNV